MWDMRRDCRDGDNDGIPDRMEQRLTEEQQAKLKAMSPEQRRQYMRGMRMRHEQRVDRDAQLLPDDVEARELDRRVCHAMGFAGSIPTAIMSAKTRWLRSTRELPRGLYRLVRSLRMPREPQNERTS